MLRYSVIVQGRGRLVVRIVGGAGVCVCVCDDFFWQKTKESEEGSGGALVFVFLLACRDKKKVL